MSVTSADTFARHQELTVDAVCQLPAGSGAPEQSLQTSRASYKPAEHSLCWSTVVPSPGKFPNRHTLLTSKAFKALWKSEACAINEVCIGQGEGKLPPTSRLLSAVLGSVSSSVLQYFVSYIQHEFLCVLPEMVIRSNTEYPKLPLRFSCTW